ncbi:NUDIX hydrolase [Paraclostridium sordellii]|uniref:NUDIX hydrolase n=1 Tax=Paraclostridium sordellii TaxID=1505 RepID=UPI001FAD3398|nr:NUDIX hydrolase N-terminal domain-containing protein [Paeniclostridium sordellii]MCR1849419.1 NUDIX hydrolase N-terminal domain-containing protein [Paeniclostridium sordellii]
MEQKWLKWANEIQSISQAGLTYSKDKYDLERFNKLKYISSEIISEYTDIEIKKVRKIINIEQGYLMPKVDIKPTKIVAILDKNKYNKPISVQSIYKVFIL